MKSSASLLAVRAGAVCLMLAVAASGIAERQKLAGDAHGQPSQARLKQIIKGRYPQLVTDKVPGVARVTILFGSDGMVARSHLEVFPDASGSLTASEVAFTRFGVSGRQLTYIGEARIVLPLNEVFVVFGALAAEAPLPAEK